LAGAFEGTDAAEGRPQVSGHLRQQIAIALGGITETALAHELFGLVGEAVFRLIESGHGLSLQPRSEALSGNAAG
jgi:hypothetical protein